MRSRNRTHAVPVVAAAVAIAMGSALAACAAPRTATASLTAADVPLSSEVTPREASRVDEAAPTRSPAEPPAGELVCTSKDAFGVRLELYVNGDKATLRRIAPSDDTEERPLHVERVEGALIADDPNESDLVSHAAIVRQHAGKRYIRLGDTTQSWSACE